MIDNTVHVSLQTIYDKLIEFYVQLITQLEILNLIYNNKALMSLLGVKSRYLKHLCDNGLLGYSRHGDKY